MDYNNLKSFLSCRSKASKINLWSLNNNLKLREPCWRIKINVLTALIKSWSGHTVLVISSMISQLHADSTSFSTTWKELYRHQLPMLLYYQVKFVMVSQLQSLVTLATSITPDGVIFVLMKGQRTPWYIFGLVLVISCYIPIYMGFKSPDNPGAEYAYYTIFPGLFNIGWAALQISHMSLVPSLTCSRKRRVIFYIYSRINLII